LKSGDDGYLPEIEEAKKLRAALRLAVKVIESESTRLECGFCGCVGMGEHYGNCIASAFLEAHKEK
jgi:hypothetical protein